jgi:glycosyltransferase involved in cell wall biosynthesis
MSGKIKLLWIGDSPAVTTGFGRVSQSVLENLYSTDRYSISVLGVNHLVGDPHKYEGMFKIYPARAFGNIYGFNRVEEIINKERPDVIVINNDLWIVAEYVKHIPSDNRIFTYSPVDALPVSKVWLRPISKVNARVGTYTNFARDGILKANNALNIDIIGHGVDTDKFYPIEDARKFVPNVPPDVFVVQNVNRNQPRKRLDLFLKALQVWMSGKSVSERKGIIFYYHGAIRDVGWNLVDLVQRWGVDDRFIITDQNNFTASQGVSLSLLCKVYNIADVHVNCSMGEGFGLSPFESAACEVVQVVPDNSASKELWEGVTPLIEIDRWEVLTGGINTEGGVISVEHLVSILEDLYQHRDKTKKLARKAYDYVHQEKLTWSYVSKQFDSIITEMLGSDKYKSKKFTEDDNTVSNN